MQLLVLVAVLLVIGVTTHCRTESRMQERINRSCPVQPFNCSDTLTFSANFYMFDPVCGMRQVDGAWHRALFLNCLVLNHANMCQKVNYVQCDGEPGSEILKKLKKGNYTN